MGRAAGAGVVETFLATTDRDAAVGAAAVSATTTLAVSVGSSVATMRSPQHMVAGTTTVSRTTL